MSLEDLQFHVLPFGSFLILPACWMLWHFRRVLSVRAILGVLVIGTCSGVALIAFLRNALLLPRLVPCLDCGLLNRWWYSDAITFLQGFGIGALLAAGTLSILARRRSGDAV
jgi:hypothetical protein